MKKILFVVTQSELGGAQRYIFDLATNLPKNQYQVEVAAGGSDKLFDQLAQAGITTHQLTKVVRSINNPLADIAGYTELKNLFRKVKPDILHLNSSKISILGSLAGKAAKVEKIIYTVHGFVFNEPLPKWKKKFYQLAEKWTGKMKVALICASEADRQTGLAYNIAPAGKLITIRHGIAKPEFKDRENAREKLNIKQNYRVIGTIANFYKTKGLKYLLQAAKKVIDTFPDVEFVIIGDGDLRPALEKQIKELEISNNIQLSGQISNASQLLSAFDIFVLPSVKEGFPYALLEAMHAQLPIIATTVGGVPEIIQDSKNGILVPPTDDEALTIAINKLLQNKNLAEQFARQANSDVNTKFTLQEMIEKTAALYEK